MNVCVGDKLICVDDRFCDSLTKGTVYTVMKINGKGSVRLSGKSKYYSLIRFEKVEDIKVGETRKWIHNFKGAQLGTTFVVKSIGEAVEVEGDFGYMFRVHSKSDVLEHSVVVEVKKMKTLNSHLEDFVNTVWKDPKDGAFYELKRMKPSNKIGWFGESGMIIFRNPKPEFVFEHFVKVDIENPQVGEWYVKTNFSGLVLEVLTIVKREGKEISIRASNGKIYNMLDISYLKNSGYVASMPLKSIKPGEDRFYDVWNYALKNIEEFKKTNVTINGTKLDKLSIDSISQIELVDGNQYTTSELWSLVDSDKLIAGDIVERTDAPCYEFDGECFVQTSNGSNAVFIKGDVWRLKLAKKWIECDIKEAAKAIENGCVKCTLDETSFTIQELKDWDFIARKFIAYGTWYKEVER